MQIFFDVDGVLIDGYHADPARHRPWDVDLDADLGVSRENFQRALFAPGGDGQEPLIHQAARGERDILEILAEVLGGLGTEVTPAAFLNYWLEKDSVVNQPLFDVIEILNKQDNMNLFVATGQEHRRAHYLWDELGFRNYFREMFYSARLGQLKDSPEFFHTIGRLLGDRNDDSPLFFDDRGDVISFAKEAGWDAHIYRDLNDVTAHPRLRPYL